MRPVLKPLCPVAIILAGACPALAQRGLHRVVPPPPLHILSPHPATSRLPVAPIIRNIPDSSTSSLNSASANSSTAGSSFTFFGGSPVSLDQLLDPTPSFGFDFEHLNAVNPDLGIKTLIDPITQQRLATAERLLRETPSAPFSFPFFSGQPVVMLEQRPPVIVLQQPPPALPTTPEETAPAPAQNTTENLPEPLRDVGTFVLVLRNGKKLSAVAFTIQDNRFVYITSNGLRRVIPVSELDKVATEQVNEDRGTPIQLPQ